MGRIPCPAQESQDVAETQSEIFTPNPSKPMDSSQKLTQHNPWKDSPLWAPKVVTPWGKSLEIWHSQREINPDRGKIRKNPKRRPQLSPSISSDLFSISRGKPESRQGCSEAGGGCGERKKAGDKGSGVATATETRHRPPGENQKKKEDKGGSDHEKNCTDLQGVFSSFFKKKLE